MSETELDLDLDELSSAEDFLEYFEVTFEPAVVHVNRLHILQRYHDYIARQGGVSGSDEERFVQYKKLLEKAYQDFVKSDAVTEKVFKVFRMAEPNTAYVPLDELGLQVKNG